MSDKKLTRLDATCAIILAIGFCASMVASWLSIAHGDYLTAMQGALAALTMFLHLMRY